MPIDNPNSLNGNGAFDAADAELKQNLYSYLEQIDAIHGRLRSRAEYLLDVLEGRQSIPQTEETAKSRVVIQAINSLGEQVTAVDIMKVIKKKSSSAHVKDRDVRRVLSRVGKRADSPLQLIEKGKGTAPNIYRKLRPVDF